MRRSLQVVGATPEGRPVYGITGRGLFIAGLPLGAVLAAIVLGFSALFTASHGATENCNYGKQAQQIDAEAFSEMRERTAAFLPHANIPGISHRELEELTEASQHAEARRIERLRQLASRTCAGL